MTAGAERYGTIGRSNLRRAAIRQVKLPARRRVRSRHGRTRGSSALKRLRRLSAIPVRDGRRRPGVIPACSEIRGTHRERAAGPSAALSRDVKDD